MTKNQLPEGVGKKIVEALKRQAEADISLLDENSDNISNSVPLTQIDDVPQVTTFAQDEQIDTVENDVIIEEEELSAVLPEGVYKEKTESVEPLETIETSSIETEVVENTEVEQKQEQPVPQLNMNQEENTQAVLPKVSFNFNEQSKEPMQADVVADKIKIPANVLVLRNLIATLPVGVSKQTGAQIIRQTLEAMGLPINNVLKEAQEVQEELNSSTRDCMLKIQEFKTRILQLEQSVQDYQRNISQINDLVSLFLLTDKK